MNRSLAILALLASCVASAFVTAVDQEARGTGQTEVIVLSTLHQLHEEVEGYSYQALSALIERLDPGRLRSWPERHEPGQVPSRAAFRTSRIR